MIKEIFMIGVLLLVSGCTQSITLDDSSIPSDIIAFNSTYGGFNQDEELGTNIDVMLTSSTNYYLLAPLNKSGEQKNENKNYILNQSTGQIILGSGIYQVYTGISFSTDKNGVVHCDVFKNGLETEIKFERSITNINQVGNANALGVISANANDYIDVRCRSSTNTNTITINNLLFNIIKIE